MYSINEINDTMQLNDIIYILTTSNNFFFLSKLYRKHRKVCDCINILFYSFLSLFHPVRLSRLLYRTYEHHPHFDLIQVVQKKKKFLLNQYGFVHYYNSLSDFSLAKTVYRGLKFRSDIELYLNFRHFK